MKKIITLSSFTTVRPIITRNPTDDWVIYDFAELFKYQKSCCSPCPSFFANAFFKLPNVLKIAHQFWQNEYTVIHDYKVGKLETRGETQTEKFTSAVLMDLFGFLTSERTASIPEAVKMSLWNERKRYLAIKDLQDINDFTHRKVAEALVQKVFCSQVLFSENDWLKIDYLIKSDESFIIVADINPLHAHYLMAQLSERYPAIEWDQHADVRSFDEAILSALVNISMMSKEEVKEKFIEPAKDYWRTEKEVVSPRQLSPTIYFAASYDYHSYSSAYNNRKFKVNEPTIMQTLAEQFGANNLEFISHFDFNRQEAENLGVKAKSLEEFFPANLQAESKKGI